MMDLEPRELRVTYDGILLIEVWNLPSASDCVSWENDVCQRAAREGFFYQRVTHHEKEPGHMLLEGWKCRPENPGPRRWFGGD